MIYAIARRICGEAAAADVTQEVFVRVWTNGHLFDETRGNLRQYLCTVARGVAIDHLRRQAAQLQRDDRHALARTGETWDALRGLIDAETAERVRRALGRLHSTERDVIMAAFYRDMTYREVAIRLGIAEGTAKSRIRTALLKLRVELADLVETERHDG